MTDLTVAQQLEYLVNHQLIRRAGEQDFAFRHALLHEAVYATLLRRERREVHGAVAAALEALYAGALDEHAADLAYHYFENENWALAQTYAQRAGEAAQRRYAPREALMHFSQAIAAAQQQGRRPPPELYRARGQVREGLGDFDGARNDHETALAAARAAGQPRAEWQTLLDLGYLWAGRDYAQTGRYFHEALALARNLPDPALLGHALNRVGNWHLNREEMDAARRCHTEALALFEQLPDDRAGLAETLDLLGLTEGSSGNLRQGQAHFERALALFRELDDRRGQASALAVMSNLGPGFSSDMVAPALTLREAHFLVDQSLKLARAIGWRAGEAYALLSWGAVRLSAGDFAEAQRHTQLGTALAAEIGHDQWQTLGHLLTGHVALELGQYAEAHAATLAACAGAERLGSVLWRRYSRAQLAIIALEQANLPAAEAALAGELDERRLPDTISQRQLMQAQGQLALQRGQPEAVLALVTRLRASLADASPEAIVPRLWKLEAEAHALRGEWAAAEALLQAALPATQPVRAWRVRASLAAVYLAQDQMRAAGEQVGLALRELHTLAATLPDPAQRRHFLETSEAHLHAPWPGGHIPA